MCLARRPRSAYRPSVLRPLLAGAAWKVLDLLVEAALGQPGKRWRIAEKISQVHSGISGPPNFGKATWDALATTYANTAELRHSLVHRQVHLDASEALVGRDKNGRPLTPLSSTEQEALAKAAVRASSLALAPAANARIEGDLLRHLHALAAWHGVQLPTHARTWAAS